jgi:ERCC4-type nuclease
MVLMEEAQLQLLKDNNLIDRSELIVKDDIRNIKIVDSAEPDKAGKAEIRSHLLEVGWRQQRLKSGDYMFFTCLYHKLGITRKTTDDFMGSLNKNFSQQLEEMLDLYDICVLLVEKPWKWIAGTGQMISARGLERHIKKEIYNYIHRWEAKGFILERTANWEETVTRLNELYALYQKPYSLSARSKGYSDDRILAFPSGCRGKTGMAILEQFGSLRAVACASRDQLKDVKLVGDKKAELIINHFNKDTNEH